MPLPLEFHAEAPGELQAVYGRYDGLRSDLADDFASAIDRAFEAITDNPLGYGLTQSDIRPAPVSGFPYAVYYRVLRNRVRVVAIHHTSRDPSVWRARK